MKTEDRDLAAEDLFECSKCHAILDIDYGVRCTECKELFCEICMGLDPGNPGAELPERTGCEDHESRGEGKIRCTGCGIPITMSHIPQDLAPEEELCSVCHEKGESNSGG